MTGDLSETGPLLQRAGAGDAQALGELFAHYRDRLRQMVRLRLDRRLQGRIDPSDVLQEVYIDFAKRLPEYAADPSMAFYLWLRSVTGQRLIDLHRQHLARKCAMPDRRFPFIAAHFRRHRRCRSPHSC